MDAAHTSKGTKQSHAQGFAVALALVYISVLAITLWDWLDTGLPRMCPDKDARPWGFSCDAWIQTVGSIIGGVATLLTVVGAFSIEHWRERRLRRSKFMAFGRDLQHFHQEIVLLQFRVAELTPGDAVTTPSKEARRRALVSHVADEAGHLRMFSFDMVLPDIAQLPQVVQTDTFLLKGHLEEWPTAARRYEKRANESTGPALASAEKLAIGKVNLMTTISARLLSNLEAHLSVDLPVRKPPF